MQAKLRVGAVEDPAERDADAFADAVMRSLDDASSGSPGAWPRAAPSATRIQRSAGVAEVGAAGGELSPATESRIRSASRGGAALPRELRRMMGPVAGNDLSSVRVHTGSDSADLNRIVRARAFTTGNHIHFAQGAYDPGSVSGQRLIAHEVGHTLQQGRVRRSVDLIHRYADIPTPATWKADSKQGKSVRSEKLKDIDEQVELYDQVRHNNDKKTVRGALNGIKITIHHWQTEKDRDKGAGNSVRQTAIDDLSTIIATKVQENLDDHEVELAPLVAELNDAFRDGDFTEARTKSAQLRAQHSDLYERTVWAALRANDNTRWATAFFSAPRIAIGAQPIHPMNIKAVPDFSWLTATQAEAALAFIDAHANDAASVHIMGMLQHAPFRNALRDKAYGYGALEAKMPLLRVAGAAENDLASRGGGAAPSIDDIAEAVFSAFLGDQPVSGLGYSTNSVDFKTANFLIGDTKGAQRAPCMTLSNMMTEIFKAVLPSGVPGAQPKQDIRPMLTRPLAAIGTRGVLTRETAFRGNVAQFGTVKGYGQVNRIFFGDGHEWLVVGNREYDPTLGVSGPIGTIAGTLEPLTFATKGSGYVASDGKKVTRNKKVPPGGGALLFQRSVVIK